jgi:hypothetical protein
VVVEMPELVGDAGHDRLIHQAEGDLDLRWKEPWQPRGASKVVKAVLC